MSEGISIDADDKQRQDIKLKVEINNMTVHNTQNSFSSLFKVFENSELSIDNSEFKRNFGKARGSVICGEYKGTNT